MAETRRQFDREFREDAVRIVRETGKPVAQVARDLGVNPGTLVTGLLGASESWFYKWRHRQPTARQQHRAELDQAIWVVFDASGGTYGSPRADPGASVPAWFTAGSRHGG